MEVIISRVSQTGLNRNKPPVPSAKYHEDTRENGFVDRWWTVEVETMEDLGKISQESGDEQLIVNFDMSGVLYDIVIYDDYIE